jgi:hypothetical protein
MFIFNQRIQANWDHSAALCAVALACFCVTPARSAEPVGQADALIGALLPKILVQPVEGAVQLSTVKGDAVDPAKRRSARRGIGSNEDSGWLVAEINSKTGETTFTIRWSRSSEQQLPEASAVHFTLPPFPEQPAPKPVVSYTESCTDGHSQSDEFNITSVYRRICINTVSERIAVTRPVLSHLAQQPRDGPGNPMMINVTMTDRVNPPGQYQLRFYPVEASALLAAVDKQSAMRNPNAK